MTELPRAPERSTGDAAHALARATIGSIPIIGAAGSELFAYVVQAPFEKRRQEWMEEIGDAIAGLRDRLGVDVEKLREDPAFTDTVLAATQAALRTRSELKRTALHEAVVNTAKGKAPDEALRFTFIGYVEEFADWHIRLLDLFEDPSAWFRRSGMAPPDFANGLSDVLETAFPELRGRRDVYDQWWRDLYARGLVNTDALHAMMSSSGAMTGRLTSRGHAFLAFVRSSE